MKPDQKIFEKLIEKTGLLPEEVLYSDDNEDKLLGAKAIGIQTFVFESYEQFLKELERHGVKIENESL